MIDGKKFVNEYYAAASESKKNDVLRYIDNLNTIIGENGNEMLKDKSTLCKSFFISKSSGISRTNYQKLKKYLGEVLAFCKIPVSVPTRDEVLSFQTLRCYYEDLTSLLDFVDKVGYGRLEHYNPNADLLNIKAIIILGWNGYSSQDIINAKKSDLYSKAGELYSITIDGKTAILDWRSFNTLSNLAFMYSYRGFPSGKLQILKGNSDYLFRPTVAGMSQSNEEQVKQALKRFNSYIKPLYNSMICFGKLHKNALFVQIYNDASDKTLFEKIVQYANCSAVLAYGYQKEYMQWLDVYHPEDEN